MKTTSFVASFLNLTSLAMAVGTPRNPAAIAFPSPIENASLKKRQYVDIYFITVCEHSAYRGRCDKLQAAWNVCCIVFLPWMHHHSDILLVNIVGENEDWASSVKPDANGNCVLYGYVHDINQQEK